jgi:elongator complex protein 4
MASFRKRNVPLRSGTSALSESPKSTKQELAQGVRPSPLDGRLTTSTGTRSLDGHAGFALGTCLLVEESGTTDFGGSLLRYYASEGVVQGHHVHVLGMNEGWGRDLPGVVEAFKSARKEGNSSGDGIHDRDKSSRSSDGGSGEKMKIAWRYERLGEFGSGPRGAFSSINYCIQMATAKTYIRDYLLIP